MGLLDILNGMQNGPRGQRAPAGPNSGGGMSPITMAVLGLLAYKALKHVTGDQQPASPGNAPGAAPAGGGLGDIAGGLGDLLSGKSGGLGGLGGLLAGGAAGSVLSGGLNDLLNQFQQKGQGDVASSWVGAGPNKEISPNDLSKVLGEDQIRTLMTQTGLSREELFEGLSEQLPGLVDRLTPQGRLPTEQEVSRLV